MGTAKKKPGPHMPTLPWPERMARNVAIVEAYIDGLTCGDAGIDIIAGEDIGDLKSAATTEPEPFMRHAFRMHYPQQLAFYRRAARANGIGVRDLFVLGVETRAPYEVVELQLTPEMVEFADRSITHWLERLRNYRLSIPEPETVYDWPGYAQAPVRWSPPPSRETDADEELDSDADEELDVA